MRGFVCPPVAPLGQLEPSDNCEPHSLRRFEATHVLSHFDFDVVGRNDRLIATAILLSSRANVSSPTVSAARIAVHPRPACTVN